MHKRTVIAFVVFVALLGVVMATIFKPQERNISRLSVPAIAAETVEKIVVDRAETYELVKEGEYWVLDDGRPADDAQIDRALESVGTLTSTELVSSNPAKHATYEVDDETGSRGDDLCRGSASARFCDREESKDWRDISSPCGFR